MPFVTTASRLVGDLADELVDPTLESEMLSLADLYASVFRNVKSAVAVARQIAEAKAGGQLNDLMLFQNILAEEISKSLRDGMRFVSEATRDQVVREGERAMANLANGLSVQLSFNASDPRAVAWSAERTGMLIAQIEDEAVTAVRQVIGDALTQGTGVYQAGRRLRDIVGLPDRWRKAVENLRERQFRDLIDRGISVSEAQNIADGMAARYAEQLLNTRALTIARTEIMAAQNVGQVLGWYQAADEGHLDLSTAVKEWIVGPSGWKGKEVCDECKDLAGETVKVEERFSNGEVMPPAHPNCRCTLNLIPLALEEI